MMTFEGKKSDGSDPALILDQIAHFCELRLPHLSQFFESSSDAEQFEHARCEYFNAMHGEQFQNEVICDLVDQLNFLDPLEPDGDGGGSLDHGELTTSSSSASFVAWFLPDFVTGASDRKQSERQAQKVANVEALLQQFPTKEAAIQSLKIDISDRYNKRYAARKRKENAMAVLRRFISALEMRALEISGESFVRSLPTISQRSACSEDGPPPSQARRKVFSDEAIKAILRKRK